MAILKHIASRNAHYNDVIEYLEYEHDAKSGKKLKDSEGNYIRREDVLMEGILCTPATFEIECLAANIRYGKNLDRKDVKSHSYIISFDPRDAADNGLTLEDVQKFGMEFARKYFPGHQAVVCSHADGHNGSGNLHCHIVFNSLRIEKVPREEYMNQISDNLPGYKHRSTKKVTRFLKSKVMEMCRERGLYQVDLLNPAGARITSREYYASLRLAENAQPGEKAISKKEELRQAIEYCAAHSKDLDDFKTMMENVYGFTVKESRGRFSFLIPGRERGITDRQLGTWYRKPFIESVIAGKVRYPDRTLPSEKAVRRKRQEQRIKRIYDISENPKAMESPGYAYVMKLSNLKKTAETLNYMAEKDIHSMSNIEERLESLADALLDNAELLKETEAEMAGIEAELKSGKLPDSKEKQAEYRKLIGRRNTLYEDRSQLKKDMKDMQTAKDNLQKVRGRQKRNTREI
ncbi:MAG: relaxase/mobilization nuclease domain-containing protein [Eubacterium sp.]|nr:relaxase/mobilization nuclease domain-containing protein [Eubacterium sp.]